MGTDPDVVVAQIVKELSPAGNADVDPDADLIAELGFDSLGLVELLVAIEDALGLSPLDAEGLGDVRSVADLQRVATEALAQQTSS
jgi:acyl carrier protein